MDWLATVVLLAGYAFLPKRKRWGAFLIGVSDIFWLTFAIQTHQTPLGIVSVWCGVFSFVSFWRWRHEA